jgi:homoserine kinase
MSESLGSSWRDARARVPCSTSNLGAGFDCVGVALDRWLDATVSRGEAGATTITRGGTLDGLHVPAESDHLVTGFRRACAARGVAPPAGLAFTAGSDIPVARGLGSSAASLVAGACLANAALDLGLTPNDLVGLGAAVEGHPDNVAPIVLGGAVLAVPRPDGAGYACAPIPVHPSLGIALAIPDFETSTRAMRAALPATVQHRDAVAAAGKAAALVHGLATGDAALLAHALDDVLHVPWRRALVRGYDDVVAAATGAGAFGATLSGSGSTILALAPHDRADAVCQAMRGAWTSLGIPAEASVAQVAEGATWEAC